MITNEQYVRLSLEFNLFFLRIAKEHAIFAAASLPPRDKTIQQQLLTVKQNYETLLQRAVSLSHNVISKEVLTSDEIVTELTLPAEESTEFLTGIPINKNITKEELNMVEAAKTRAETALTGEVSRLNNEALVLTNRTIAFLNNLYRNISECKAFSYTYPTMLHHVTEESKFAAMMLTKLQNKDAIDSVKEIIDLEIFWNHIMEEHSMFIRGYLDPAEKQLFEKANDFAKKLELLVSRTMELRQNPKLLPEITRESINQVTELRNFKKQGAEGILACEIKSIIPPLLADHVLREANHYLRLLNTTKTM
ncbi:hypothetical protein HMPREF1982_01034 [Clostridiales bacterium oral taxon 876 str. F0540]|nr:hypothetical protein HMPREF1982_01034 [Clostridiales bacterium oral taxon 876 str. F0540]